MTDAPPKAMRTMFISDVHLGTRGCQADMLLDCLKRVDAETIYLVGDIVDGWRLKSGWYWPQAHNDIVQKLLRKVRKGARVIYVPGNHDEFLRDYIGANFGGVEIAHEAIHYTADDRRMLVLHGDKYDVVVTNVRWLAYLGDWAYDLAISLNSLIGLVRRRFELPYWSFSGWSKRKVKRAVNYIGAFENAVATDAARAGVDGVICGHIHQAAMRSIGPTLYVNTGDWVDTCSVVVEDFTGELNLVHWANTEEVEALLSPAPRRLQAVA